MVMPYGWEGNRRSDVAKAMRHRLQTFGLNGLQVMETSTPPMLHKWLGRLYHFYPLQVRIQVRRFQVQVQLKVIVYKLQSNYKRQQRVGY